MWLDDAAAAKKLFVQLTNNTRQPKYIILLTILFIIHCSSFFVLIDLPPMDDRCESVPHQQRHQWQSKAYQCG